MPTQAHKKKKLHFSLAMTTKNQKKKKAPRSLGSCLKALFLDHALNKTVMGLFQLLPLDCGTSFL